MRCEALLLSLQTDHRRWRVNACGVTVTEYENIVTRAIVARRRTVGDQSRLDTRFRAFACGALVVYMRHSLHDSSPGTTNRSSVSIPDTRRNARFCCGKKR